MDESRRKRVVAVSVIVGFLAAFPFMAAAAFVYLRYVTRRWPRRISLSLTKRQSSTSPSTPESTVSLQRLPSIHIDNLVAGAHVYVVTAPFAMEHQVKTAASANGNTPMQHDSGQNTQAASSASVMILRMFRYGR